MWLHNFLSKQSRPKPDLNPLDESLTNPADTTSGADLGGGGLGAHPSLTPDCEAQMFATTETPLCDVGKISLGPSPYINPGSAPELHREKDKLVPISAPVEIRIVPTWISPGFTPEKLPR